MIGVGIVTSVIVNGSVIRGFVTTESRTNLIVPLLFLHLCLEYPVEDDPPPLATSDNI